jgi:aminoglycoside phosphotransferase
MELFFEPETNLDAVDAPQSLLNQPNLLHKGYQISTEKLKSSQGTVFFVRDQARKEFVLKIYDKQQFDTYELELNLMTKLQQSSHDFFGFPKLISSKLNEGKAEVLMEALGPNFLKLQRQCKNEMFSKSTAYSIGI